VLLTWLCEKQLHIPSLSDAIDAFLQNHAYTLGMEWAALIWSVTAYTLQIAIYGHFVIGVARMAGFQLPRSTWRVLESRTLIEYFNRFHYYFKELLVDFFFIPTFSLCSKKNQGCACFLQHSWPLGWAMLCFTLCVKWNCLRTMGVGGMVETYLSYLFYCFVLATGIGISQVRANAGYKPSPSVWGRVQSFVVVWGFVTLLHIFSDESRNHTFLERMHYLIGLFGIN
jgi:D-alanyl-lipoteichoic acid acyltransferase DltB (MBOAT superfamily)